MHCYLDLSGSYLKTDSHSTRWQYNRLMMTFFSCSVHKEQLFLVFCFSIQETKNCNLLNFLLLRALLLQNIKMQNLHYANVLSLQFQIVKVICSAAKCSSQLITYPLQFAWNASAPQRNIKSSVTANYGANNCNSTNKEYQVVKLIAKLPQNKELQLLQLRLMRFPKASLDNISDRVAKELN